jgi:hypothetical protein
VRLNLTSERAVAEATSDILKRARAAKPDARITGVAVFPMIVRPKARELIVGVADDPTFGPIIVFGQGGTAVEVISDKAMTLPPLNLALAQRLIARTRVSRILEAYRNVPAADERAIELLVSAGLIEDATKIWWDMRPSARFKTLEMRITDVCPLIDDGIAIASLYRCILRLLYRLRRQNQRWRYYPPFLLRENRWRAQRYGVEQGLAQLVLTLVEFLRQLLERQAVRRMEGGSLSDEEVERVGLALMKLEEKVHQLADQFGLRPADLNINLGPLGDLL